MLLIVLVATARPARPADIPDASTVHDRVDAAEAFGDNARDVVVATGPTGETHTTEYRLGANHRIVVDFPSLHYEQGVKDDVRWRQGFNGLTVLDDPDPGNEHPEHETTTVTLEDKPIAALVVSRTRGDGSGDREFIDPATYHRLRHVTFNTYGTITTTFDTYARFGPSTLPSHWTQLDSRNGQTTTFTRVAHDVGVVHADDVAIPPIRRTLVEFPAGTVAVKLPVHVERDHIFVRVNVGSRGLDFVLDTGASGIFIDEGVARQLGFTPVQPVVNSGGGAGQFVESHVVIPALSIGPLSMHNVVMTTIPTFAEYTPDTHPVGLLGFDFLATLGVTIDYEHGTVTVVPANLFQPPSGPDVHTIDVRVGSGSPQTTVGINGQVSDRFIIDSGAAGTFLITPRFTRLYPGAVSAAPAEQGVTLRGVGGDFGAGVYAIHDLALGRNIHFANFRGWVLASGRSYSSGEDGLFGAEFLRYFTVDLDYTRGEIYLRRNGYQP